jgi:hypothetical protein
MQAYANKMLLAALREAQSVVRSYDTFADRRCRSNEVDFVEASNDQAQTSISVTDGLYSFNRFYLSLLKFHSVPLTRFLRGVFNVGIQSRQSAV